MVTLQTPVSVCVCSQEWGPVRLADRTQAVQGTSGVAGQEHFCLALFPYFDLKDVEQALWQQMDDTRLSSGCGRPVPFAVFIQVDRAASTGHPSAANSWRHLVHLALGSHPCLVTELLIMLKGPPPH